MLSGPGTSSRFRPSSGRRGIGGSSVYSATKAAQIGLIEGLRAEFAGTSLRASVIYPVSTVTEFHHAIARDFGQYREGKGPKQSADRVAQAIVELHGEPARRGVPVREREMAGRAERRGAGAGG